jgi:hypothetical protein
VFQRKSAACLPVYLYWPISGVTRAAFERLENGRQRRSQRRQGQPARRDYRGGAVCGIMLLGTVRVGLVPCCGVRLGTFSRGMRVGGGQQCLPSQTQPLFLQASAGSVCGKQVLPFQIQPFFRHCWAGLVGAKQELPVQTQPFFMHWSAGLIGGKQVLRLLFHTQPFFLHSSAGFAGGRH